MQIDFEINQQFKTSSETSIGIITTMKHTQRGRKKLNSIQYMLCTICIFSFLIWFVVYHKIYAAISEK